MFSFFAIAGLAPILGLIFWLQRHLPEDRKSRARVQAGISTGVLAVVLGVSFACDNVEDAIANSGPAQVWKGDPGSMVYLGLAPVPSVVCLDQIRNKAWSEQIPQGLVAVTFRMGLRDYRGLVREAEWHRPGFIRPMTPVEENAPTKFSFESAPPTDEENGP